MKTFYLQIYRNLLKPIHNATMEFSKKLDLVSYLYRETYSHRSTVRRYWIS